MHTSSDQLLKMVTTKPDALSLDDVFRLYSNGLRRDLLLVLHEMESPTALQDVAARLAAQDDVETEAVDRIETHLHHTHLPKLAELGVVDYNSTEATIELTQEGQTLAEALTE